MARRVFYDRAATLDAGHTSGGPGSGTTFELGGPPVSQSSRLVAVLPGSPADYEIIAGGGGSQAELWEIQHARGDPGVDPRDAEEVRERLAAMDRAFVRQPTADRGRALGRARREADGAALRSFNARARRRYA